jgi:hypothetical protein
VAILAAQAGADLSTTCAAMPGLLMWDDLHFKLVLQTEKQRIIWAYKILFLDVLFPLSLKRVIFADSDQIIRADFADLWHMDLQVNSC